MKEEFGDKRDIANTINNIGIIYGKQGDYSNELKCYLNALKLNEELGNIKGIASNIMNIGTVYHDQANFSIALEYFFKSLKLFEELGRKTAIATNLMNIGNIYAEQGDNAFSSGDIKVTADKHSNALEYWFKALKINEEIGNKLGITLTLGNIGELYTKQKKYSLAEYYLLQALNRSTV